MKIVYGKQLNNSEINTINEIARACSITFDTARLLFYRNQDSVEKAKRFLNPSKRGFHNPYLLKDMDKAIEIIKNAKLLNKKVLIFGDYDADGICAATVLYQSLKDYGIKALRVFVPERASGYGINLSTIDQLEKEEKIDLLITVDCGVSDSDKIEQLTARGIDVIVTDHHEPPEILPSCITINPKISNQSYPFDGLCGAGVAYKLACALIGEKANDYLDFVALATVADSMDLIDENRDIVAEGLKLFNNPNKNRSCMKYLIGDNNKTILAQTLAYSVAPRINAGGRMGDANCALQLFISTEENIIYDLAIKLNKYNIQRQFMCDEIYQKAKEKIKKYSLDKRSVILVKDSKWQTGFVGIVAAKLVEEYSRPVIVFAGQDDCLKGSARSVDGINIYEAICANKEYLIGFGGHSQAAGVSVAYESFSQFDKAINDYISEKYSDLEIEQKISVEWNVKKAFSNNFVHEIELLEPFGIGNRSPLFSIDVNKIYSLPIKEGSPHYSFKTDILEMMDFNGEKNVNILALPINKKIVFDINISNFKNREYIKGFVKVVCPDYSDLSSLNLHAFENKLDIMFDEEDNYKEIEKESLQIRNNTLYIISDEKNLELYPQLKDVPRSFAKVNNKKYASEIVYAPINIPEGYDRIVYLDKPLHVYKSCAKNYVINNVSGLKVLERISTDREEFAKTFKILRSCENKTINSLAEFSCENAGEMLEEQFLFSLKVFLELKIFNIKNGKLVYDEKVKNALTNSKLYCKIVLLKEKYV